MHKRDNKKSLVRAPKRHGHQQKKSSFLSRLRAQFADQAQLRNQELQHLVHVLIYITTPFLPHYLQAKVQEMVNVK